MTQLYVYNEASESTEDVRSENGASIVIKDFHAENVIEIWEKQ